MQKETCKWRIQYIANNGIHERYYIGCTNKRAKWINKRYTFCPECGKPIEYVEGDN